MIRNSDKQQAFNQFHRINNNYLEVNNSYIIYASPLFKTLLPYQLLNIYLASVNYTTATNESINFWSSPVNHFQSSVTLTLIHLIGATSVPFLFLIYIDFWVIRSKIESRHQSSCPHPAKLIVNQTRLYYSKFLKTTPNTWVLGAVTI